MRAAASRQKFEKFPVAVLGGNVRVDQRQAQGKGGAIKQIGIDEACPLLGNVTGDFRVAVAGQIGKQQFGFGLASTANLKES